jgi:RHS repeat-associated protein
MTLIIKNESTSTVKDHIPFQLLSFTGMMSTFALLLTLAVVIPFSTPVFAVTPSNCELPDGDIDGDECITQNTAKNNGSANPDCTGTPTCTGDPINVATGSKYENEVDYVSGGSSPLLLRRSYNSSDTGTSSFGVSWRGAYSRAVSAQYYGLFIVNGYYQYKYAVDVTRDDGKTLTFYQNGSQWQPDSDVNSRLTQLSTGWQYTTGLDEVEIYNANGQLTSVTDRAGLSQSLSYDAQGHLTSVTNPFGRSLTFAYTGSKVTSVTVPNGGVYAYSYDANNNLATVTYPDNTQRKFLYENSSYPHALTGVIDENANRYSTDAYDGAGRDISNELAGGVNKYALNYSYLTYGYVPVTDALGVTRTSTFTNINQVALETLMSQSCPGCPAAYATTKKTTTYDANGNITSQTDFNGNTTNYSYDTTRNLQISRTEAAGTSQARTITTAWHASFRLPLTITEPTRTTSFSYDDKGNLLQKTITAGAQTKTWTFTYNANSQPLTLDGPRTDVSDVTHFAYDSQGNLSTISDALGHVTTITSYNADGQPLSLKDANGLVTSFQYDARGRLTSSTSGTEVTGYSYDAAGQLIKVTLPDASYLTYSYDNAHRLIGFADSLGNHINYTLDIMGNRLSTQTFDPANTLTKTRSQIFDGLSRVAKSIGAQNQTAQFGYDANGNTTSVADPLNNKTTLAYDPLNRLISSIDPLAKTTTSTYDSNNNPLVLTDPLSHSTGYSYDGFGQKLTTASPDTGRNQNSYDAAGNVLSTVDARGQTVNYNYDALNRVIQIIYPNKPPISFAYDEGANGMGHLTHMMDGAGTTVTSWTYDVHGRVSSKTFRSGTLVLVTGYSYDAYGRLATLTYPSGKVVQLSYNSNGQVIELDSNGLPLISGIHYQPFGSPKNWTFGNGISTSRGFDQDGRINAYDLGNRSRQLAYDAAGRITSYTDTDLNHDQSFTYDALGRLTGYTDPATQTAYSYDANGNRTQEIGSLINNYNNDSAGNRLLSITGNNNQTLNNYNYDASGNLLNDGTTTFSYDGRGRLAQASNVSLGTEQYLINGLGQRVAKVIGTPPDLAGDANQDGVLTVNDARLIVLMTQGIVPVNLVADCNHDGKITTADASCVQAKIIDMRINPIKYVQSGTYFVYDGAGHLLGEYNPNGTPIQETVWLGDMPVAVLSGNSQYYVYADHLNAPRAISDSTGTTVWRWDSDAFGTTLANEDPDGNGITFTYNLRFPGQYYDKGTGLHYNGFRDYNPAIGRYIESDPIGLKGGVNTYAYIENNPLLYTDPTGKVALIDNIIGGLINVGIDYALHKATGQCYGFGNFLLDFGLGFATDGLSALNDLRNASILAKATKAEILAANKAAGAAAEAQAASDLIAEGNTILGSQVSVRTAGGRRVVDHLIETPEGDIVAVEVKSGDAVRNSSQLAKDQLIATEGGVIIGKNAPDALKGQQLIINTIERRY